MKKGAMVTLTAVGFVLIVVGLCYLKAAVSPTGMMTVLPYLCIGAGCGAFGHGMGEILGRRALKNAPDRQKQIEIEQHDERNLAIANRAKGKAYDAMVYIFGALLFSFGLMGVALHVILLLLFAYLLVVGIFIYYRCKFDREM